MRLMSAAENSLKKAKEYEWSEQFAPNFSGGSVSISAYAAGLRGAGSAFGTKFVSVNPPVQVKNLRLLSGRFSPRWRVAYGHSNAISNSVGCAPNAEAMRSRQSGIATSHHVASCRFLWNARFG
jgi:hypothetical protein